MCTAAGRHRNASLSQARNAPAGLFRPTARRSTEPPLREGKVNHSCPLGKVCPQAIHLQSTRKAAGRVPAAPSWAGRKRNGHPTKQTVRYSTASCPIHPTVFHLFPQKGSISRTYLCHIGRNAYFCTV